MGNFNRFGATEAQVADLFTSASYLNASVLADMGGTTVIDAVMDRISREVAETFAPKAYDRLVHRVHGEAIIYSAKGGEVSGTMTLGPVIPSSVHIWRVANERCDEMVVGFDEYFAWTLSGQVITPSQPMVRTEYLYASYTINVEDPTFSMPSVADKVLLGCAAELAQRLYVISSDPWPLLDDYKNRWNTWKETAMENKWVPDEMRRMLFWEPVDRASMSASSVRPGRA